MSRFTFTSESVSEGHPDKVCDYISDSILDACFEQDPHEPRRLRDAGQERHVVLAGEITTNAKLDYEKIVRQAVKEIGYTDTREPFCDTTLKVDLADHQAVERDLAGRDRGDEPERRSGRRRPGHHVRLRDRRIAGDDAAADSARAQADEGHGRRSQGRQVDLPPPRQQVAGLASPTTATTPKDVTAVVVSTQHTPDADQKRITEYVREELGPRVLGSWWRKTLHAVREPDRQLHPRRTVGRRRRHRPQDHRRQLRRLGPARRRRVQRQGSVEGRSQQRVLLPLRREAGRRRRASRRRPRFRSATPSAWRSRCR